MDIGAELLHEELHHPLGTRHIVFGLHVDVSEKSFQDQSKASICPLCAKFHHPNPKNKKVMKIYSQISIKSNPLIPVNARFLSLFAFFTFSSFTIFTVVTIQILLVIEAAPTFSTPHHNV